MFNTKVYICALLASVLTGCVSAPPPLYNWGTYPQQNYLMFVTPEKATATTQITKLEAEVEKSKATGLAVPPGLYAHLGLLYLQTQNAQKAASYFELERQTYPESTILMDRLLQKNTNNTGKTSL